MSVLNKVKQIKSFIRGIVKTDIIEPGVVYTKPGSAKYMLFGEQPSEQSVCVKWGNCGEKIFKYIIECFTEYKLLKCGVQLIDKKDKKKDFDLVFEDVINKVIYFRELKVNIELDSEKIVSTFSKVDGELKEWLETKYPTYSIDVGILNWSIYNRNIPNLKTKSHIKKCEKNNVKVDHVEDMFKLTDLKWEQEDWEKFNLEIGSTIKKNREQQLKNS